MSTNLLEAARQLLTPDAISQAAAFVGASPEATGKAIASAGPLLLGGLANAASTPTGADALLSALSSGRVDPTMLSDLPHLLSNPGARSGLLETGAGIVSQLFGDKSGSVANALASFSGLSAGGGSNILNMIAPLLLAVAGKQLMAPGGGGLTQPALMSLFGQQKEHLHGGIPAVLLNSLKAIPGLGWLGMLFGAAPAAAATVRPALPPEPARDESRGLGGWLPWLLGLGALGLLLWWLLGREKPEPVATTETPAAVEPAPVVTELAPDPNATVESCTEEFRMALAGDTIYFDTDKATIQARSHPLLDKLAVIAGRCSAYKIEVQGHTDATGGPEVNLPLSQDRAQAVLNYLASKGVRASQLSGVGYGATRPVDTGTSEEALAKNRRIEFVVTN